jgi:Flp pilus assembly pilin Flp
MGKRLQTFWRRTAGDEGVAIVEYALLLALIAASCFAAIQAVGSPVSGLFNQMTTAIESITF